MTDADVEAAISAASSFVLLPLIGMIEVATSNRHAALHVSVARNEYAYSESSSSKRLPNTEGTTSTIHGTRVLVDEPRAAVGET